MENTRRVTKFVVDLLSSTGQPVEHEAVKTALVRADIEHGSVLPWPDGSAYAYVYGSEDELESGMKAKVDAAFTGTTIYVTHININQNTNLGLILAKCNKEIMEHVLDAIRKRIESLRSEIMNRIVVLENSGELKGVYIESLRDALDSTESYEETLKYTRDPESMAATFRSLMDTEHEIGSTLAENNSDEYIARRIIYTAHRDAGKTRE